MYSGQSFSYDSGIADTLGLHAAIVFNHIVYWLRHNAKKKDKLPLDWYDNYAPQFPVTRGDFERYSFEHYFLVPDEKDPLKFRRSIFEAPIRTEDLIKAPADDFETFHLIKLHILTVARTRFAVIASQILKDLGCSPFNFLQESNSSQQAFHRQQDADTSQLLSREESDKLERKECLFVDDGELMTSMTIRAIISFLNSHGGVLLVGVSDDGEAVGLNHEIEVFHGEDKYRQKVANLLANNLDASALANVRHELEEMEGGKTILRFDVKPSSVPIFPKKEGKIGEGLIVRFGNITKHLKNAEMLKYKSDHWVSSRVH
jgi:hypothetical protein